LIVLEKRLFLQLIFQNEHKKMAENQQGQDFNVTEVVGKTEDFINQNKKSLGIIIGALVIAIGGYLFYQRVYVAGKEKEAQSLLFHSEQYFKEDSLRLAINGDGNNPGLEEIANEYGMSPSGNLAKYYLGMAYLKQNEYQKAIETLKSYDANDDITPSLVLGAIGDAYFGLKENDEAISYYEKSVREKPNNFSTPILMMKLAATLEESGKYKEAKETYEKIQKEYPTSNEGVQMQKYITRAEVMMENSK